MPPTSTTTRCRSWGWSASATSPAYGSSWLSKSVSIQVVWTSNFSPSPTYAGSETTARWNGITVGIPSTSNSSSARRARSSAWVRSRPVTIIFPISESNAPLTESPAVTLPESRRMPGPHSNVLKTWMGPGWEEPAAGVFAVDAEFDRVADRPSGSP